MRKSGPLASMAHRRTHVGAWIEIHIPVAHSGISCRTHVCAWIEIPFPECGLVLHPEPHPITRVRGLKQSDQ